MPFLCCHRISKAKREDQYKVADDPEESPVGGGSSPRAMFSWEHRQEMDMERYRIRNLEGTTEVRRGIAGQPMAIEGCKNSHLLVLDHTSTITVDDCSDCLIVLGPCAGSVFLRECQSCTVLVACQQLRTRDCHKLRLALHCATQPIIEETSNAVFHQLALHYESFTDDLIGARLSPFFSHLSSVHDFTPEKGSAHYQICSDNLTLSPEHESILMSHGVSTNVCDSDIPFPQKAFGETHYYYAECIGGEPRLPFVEKCQKVATAVIASPSLALVATNEIDLRLHGAKLGMATKRNGTLVVFEVGGDEDLLEELMCDGGFEKVADHEEQNFASALATINQMLIS